MPSKLLHILSKKLAILWLFTFMFETHTHKLTYADIHTVSESHNSLWVPNFIVFFLPV